MLPLYKKILVATDLTPNSTEAFRHAVMLARHNDAKLYLLHSIPEVDQSMRSYVSAVMGEGHLEEFEKKHQDEVIQEIRSRLREFTEKELADHPEDLKRIEDIELDHGAPVPHILLAADRLNVDVIVMGSHGKGAISHAFLGSVSEKVLRKSKRPVFIIPLPD